MGYEPETAIVRYKNKWYVYDCCLEGNYEFAITDGKCFDSESEARSYAFTVEAECGIHSYYPFAFQVHERLAIRQKFKRSPNPTPKFWEQELKESNERKSQLALELKKHGLEIRDDSVMCCRLIDGDTTQSLDSVVKSCVEMNFLFKHTQYRRCRDKEIAWRHYKTHHPGGDLVPELLRDLFDSK
jgi:hypothetical protein